jgi:protein phosphatase
MLVSGERGVNNPRVGAFVLHAVGATDAGRRREQNEDALLVLDRHAVFAVADGMGGYAAGEVASRLAMETLTRAFDTGVFEGNPDPHRPRRADELVRAIEMANRAIHAEAAVTRSEEGMGTTIAALCFARAVPRGWVAHVGDSRVYRCRAGSFEALTRDHTLAASGLVGPTAGRLIRAVGVDETVQVDLAGIEVRAGDRYLLCTDGLTKMIDDAGIAEILAAEPDAAHAVRALIDRANERGGRDNVTVLIVEVATPGV